MSRPRAGAGGGAAPSRTRWTHRPPGAGLHAGHDAAAWPQRPPPPSAGAAAAALRSRRLRCQPQPQPRPQRGRRGRGDPGPPGRSCCLSVLPRPIAQEKSLLQRVESCPPEKCAGPQQCLTPVPLVVPSPSPSVRKRQVSLNWQPLTLQEARALLRRRRPRGPGGRALLRRRPPQRAPAGQTRGKNIRPSSAGGQGVGSGPDKAVWFPRSSRRLAAPRCSSAHPPAPQDTDPLGTLASGRESLPDVGIRPDVRTPAHSLNLPFALIQF
ncbi:Latent-transforming growth factor beta-binding protein 4 [Vulpes lagopus]